jgi:hypothetical protein
VFAERSSFARSSVAFRRARSKRARRPDRPRSAFLPASPASAPARRASGFDSLFTVFIISTYLRIVLMKTTHAVG